MNVGWERFSKHLAFVVGDGSRIRFWHDRWVGDTSLKMLYPQLYACSSDKEACISNLPIFLTCWIIRRIGVVDFGT